METLIKGQFIKSVYVVYHCTYISTFFCLKGGIAPFGQVPLLEIKDGTSSKSIMLCQSVAILRYLANEFGR